MRTSRKHLPLLLVALAASSAGAQAQEVLLGDLDSKSPRKLSKEELGPLLTGASMHRLTRAGNNHAWTNDADGSFIVSSDNSSGAGIASSANGKWHISDDGRYCVLIEWKRAATEEWCRYLFTTSEGYYSTKSDVSRTERVYKLDIKPR
jgi:hypothetical protein